MQPSARRGTLTLKETDPNAAASPSSTSPLKAPSERSYPFAEGTYQGSWACGRPEGRGVYTSSLGSSFSGVWRRGWADGTGIFSWVDGRADVSRFQGEAERLPLLAASGEGVRWNRDRSKAVLLRNGIETGEAISRERAEEIAERLGVQPAVPPPRMPPAVAPARVSKRELQNIHELLNKSQRTDIDAKLRSRLAEAGDDDLPFESLWEVIMSA